MAKRNPVSRIERMWTNAVDRSNDIVEIGLVAKIQEHPLRNCIRATTMFAAFYSEYTEATKGLKAARIAAMTQMIYVLDHMGEYWNKKGK